MIVEFQKEKYKVIEKACLFGRTYYLIEHYGGWKPNEQSYEIISKLKTKLNFNKRYYFAAERYCSLLKKELELE